MCKNSIYLKAFLWYNFNNTFKNTCHSVAAILNSTVSNGPLRGLGLHRPCNPANQYVWIWCCFGNRPEHCERKHCENTASLYSTQSCRAGDHSSFRGLVWTFCQDVSVLSWSPSGSQWTPSLLMKCRWIHSYCIGLQSCQGLLAHYRIFMDVYSYTTQGISEPKEHFTECLSWRWPLWRCCNCSLELSSFGNQ